MNRIINKKSLCTLMVLALLFTIVPYGAGQAQAAQYSPFHDVPTTHWALPHIMKTELRGVIAGYGDGVFKPDATVTQLEAIVMAVRAMGLENETHNTNAFVDTSAYVLPTTWNARGFVSVAIKNKLIDEQTFRPTAGASRAWTAQLLIRALRMEDEISVTAGTSFKDDSTIPVWAKPYVALAVDKGVISGIANTSGGFDYRPNDAVTRAQLATLISRSDRYMNDVKGQLPIGIIDTIANNKITVVKNDGTRATYNVTATTTMYSESYTTIAQNQLRSENLVRFHADANENVKYIEKIVPAHYLNLPVIDRKDIVKGSIVQIFPDQRVLVVKKEDNSLYTGQYTSNTVMRDTIQNRNITISELHVGDQVEVTLSDNIITKVDLIKTSQEAVLKGKIFAINIESGLLTLDNNGRYTSYTFDDGVNVVYEGIRFATVRDLRVGDEIQLQLENTKIIKITLVTPYRASNYQGNVISVSVVDKVITIVTTELTPIAYRVTDQTNYTIPNVVHPTLADIETGDQVSFTVDGQSITKLEVINRSTLDAVKGKLINLNTTLKLITIETSTKELKTYKYDDTLEIYIDENSNGKLTDLRVEDNVTLTIDKNVLKRVTIHNTIEGEIEAYDKTRNTITIKHSGGTVTYELSSNIDIHLLDNNRPVLDDLKRGMEVIAYIESNRIKKIEVKTSFSSVITSVNTDWDRIEVQDPKKEGEKLRYFAYSDTKLVIEGIADAKLSNFRVNDAVRMEFTGYSLKQVTYIPPIYGTVASINVTNNTIAIRSQFETKQVTINSNLDIYSAAGNRMSASNLKVDDYVKAVTIGDRTILNQATATDVEFYAVASNRAYYYDSGRNYRNMELDRVLQIWKGNAYYLPGDLVQGANITIYQTDNRIVGIRIK